ncbi:hypothetical protein EV401DRAFT_1895469 [Pisolithus croceorrhizus]|nr:hypothetical protein EV401DRAFT_1895469 [Pisolithus croceorrhizus]
MDANETSRPRTRAKNATTHPGDIVLQAQGKRRSKAEKAADDKLLKDSLAVKEKARKEGIARLAEMELELEAKQAATKKLAPVRPRPRIKSKGAVPTMETEASEHDNDGNGGPVSTPRRTPGIKSLKEQINVAKAQRHLEATKQQDPVNAAHPRSVSNLKWNASVAAAKSPATSTADSSSRRPPSTLTFRSLTTQSSNTTSFSNRNIVPQGPSADTPELDGMTEAFGDTVDDENERASTVDKDKKGENAKRVVAISPASADSDGELNNKIILPSACAKGVGIPGSVTGKRKVEEVDALYDSEPDDIGAPYQMEINDPTPRDVEEAHRMLRKESGTLRTTASIRPHVLLATSVGVIHEPIMPLQKKVKVEEIKYTIAPSPMDAVFSTSDASTSSTPAMFQYDAEGYIIENIKKRYTIKDLPVPSNDSAQPNVWVIPEESLVATVQMVWNTVFPHVKYRVTPDGSVMAIIQQCLAEWSSGIGSTAICIVIDFFSKLDDDMDIVATAEGLLEDYAFLCESPGKPSSEGMFRSPFLIKLLSTAHLNDVMGYVDIPQLAMKELAAGKDMAGVVGMASVALERAVKYIAEGIIDVDKVLADMMEAGDGKIRFKLPRVLNKATGKSTSTSFNFSWSNWGVESMAYRDSIAKWGPQWLRTTVEAAQQARQLKVATTSSANTDDHGMDGVNPRALLLTVAQQF